MKNLFAAKQFFITKKKSRLMMLIHAGLMAFSIFIFVSGTITANAAPTDLTGEWTAQIHSEKPDMLYIMFTRRPNITSINQTSRYIPLKELQALTPQTIASGKANVNFRIAREAGTFEFEGLFKDGKGIGFWTLTPNQSFVSELRNRGYDNLTENDLLSAALSNLTVRFVEDLKSAGFAQSEFGRILKARSSNLTPDFIRDIRSAGFENLTIDQIIRAKTYNIDSDYVNQVKAMGFEQPPLETLIKMRKNNINIVFVTQMRSAGFANLSVEQLIKLKNSQVTPEFVNDIMAEGYSAVSPEAAIRLKSNKVDRDFIRRVKANGLTDASLDQIIKLRRQNSFK